MKTRWLTYVALGGMTTLLVGPAIAQTSGSGSSTTPAPGAGSGSPGSGSGTSGPTNPQPAPSTAQPGSPSVGTAPGKAMPSMQPGAGQTALVTGASYGIGVDLAECFARDGYDLVVTAQAVELLDTIGLADRKLLFVVDGLEEAAIKSFRNLRTVHLITFDQLNTYDVLHSDAVVFTRDSLDAFCGRSAGEQAADEELVLEEGDSE